MPVTTIDAPLRYRLSLPRPASHTVEVELRVAPDGAAPLRLEMAAWAPGSYLIRDYARHMRDLVVTDAATGRALEATQIDKRTWEVAPGGAAEVLVRYDIYGHELTVRTNHIDATHAFLHGPATFVFPTAARDRAVEVEVVAPDGWPVVTGLEPVAGAQHRFTAPCASRCGATPRPPPSSRSTTSRATSAPSSTRRGRSSAGCRARTTRSS